MEGRRGARVNGWPGIAGFFLLGAGLLCALPLLPPLHMDEDAGGVLFTAGALAAWRYSWGLANLARSVIYRKIVFPRWRRLADAREKELLPPHMYFLMTSFRIDAATSLRTVRAMVEEAAACGIPSTIVASIVEKQDESLFTAVFTACDPPDRVCLKIVRVPGTGKRDGLAQGFRAISRDMPDARALVAVIDGDTLLTPGVVRRCAPFFGLFPRVGALTTDEFCESRARPVIRHWHDLRFAQRHVYMGSVALSRRVTTLTGRLSVFRAPIATHPDFIAHMQGDYLDHGRLGRFRFLTGDDKSSLYWLLERGYEQLYVPDAAILTIEDGTRRGFVRYSTPLMLRWFGNMLRTNARVLGLGAGRMPFFVWWTFLDQRISMWTTLSGPVFAAMLSLRHGTAILAWYFMWVIGVRWVMSLALLTARPRLDWRYPFLLYYNHVYGALLKAWALFRLDRQSWTRQETRISHGLSRGWAWWNRWSSHAVHASALCLLVAFIGVYSEALAVPRAALRMLAILPS